MNPLLEQFISEARDFLQGIGEKLMQLEQAPDDAELMVVLFRLVHTLKGNSGLFEFPEMTRVLHAGEDLMDAVRHGRVAYSQALADQLLDAMDFVGLLCDEIESGGAINAARAIDAVRLAKALRDLIAPQGIVGTASVGSDAAEKLATDMGQPTSPTVPQPPAQLPLADIPEAARLAAFQGAQAGNTLHWLTYTPIAECFFQGDDPFFNARQTPGIVWCRIAATEPWPALAALDAYRCVLSFELLTTASRAELLEQYRYVADQIVLTEVNPLGLALPQGDPNGGPVYEDFVSDALRHLENGKLPALRQAALTMLHLSNPDLWLSSALRWLLVLLDSKPHNLLALRVLVESLRTLQPPDWSGLTVAAPHHANANANESTSESDAPLAANTAHTNGAASSLDAPASSLAAPARYALTAAQLAVIDAMLAAQHDVLALEDHPSWQAGRLKAAARVLTVCCQALGERTAAQAIAQALAQDLANANSLCLLAWYNTRDNAQRDAQHSKQADAQDEAAHHAHHSTLAQLGALPAASGAATAAKVADTVVQQASASAPQDKSNLIATRAIPTRATGIIPLENVPAADDAPKFGRRADDGFAAANAGAKSLKVDQSKIDRLMNLIGEMVVSKNALPYLAQRAEEHFGVRELSREIKSQYAVINRIAEEMQDAIMQVRMMPVSFVFQRFPRLVRDISRKLGKEVDLVLEGEETEADKNIIESLADPLIHIVRNSLDHGFETADVRQAAGKPATGTLTIRAVQEGDRVLIDIIDDGRGIDPAIIKRKAYEKGVIDEATLERISDRDAINLVFAAGFSTMEVVSDLSGRGVGMDVVRTAVEKVNGTLLLESDVGKGTRLRITLPLSMAVTNVMIVEADQQIFGIPMDHVVETVRIPVKDIRVIKRSQTVVLRGNIVPLKALNTLLGLSAPPHANADNEMAVLVARVGGAVVGLIVDSFRETAEIIQKPLGGVLAGLGAYSGSALMGDGAVLMVLNIREMV